MFRRRKNEQIVPESSIEATEVESDNGVEDREAAEPQTTGIDRSGGPFDLSELPEDGITRLDLGGVLIPGADGMQLRLESDDTGENIIAVTVLDGDSTMQLMAFAAPRTDGIWDEVREEIRANLASGGLVDVIETDFGQELRATISVAGPQGQSAMQPVRFVGIDGPRWFLRALFGGAAARDRKAASGLESVLRATVVVRGSDPMAPGDQLPLHLPTALPEGMARAGEDDSDADEGSDRPPLTMPERGPEITEIR